MSKNMNLILNDKKEKDAKAREYYLSMRNNLDKYTVDLMKKKDIKPAEINSDMALFRSTVGDKQMVYYYNRLEIKQGGNLTVTPFFRCD